MKNIFGITILFCFFLVSAFGQSVNLESTVCVDTAKSQISVQRIEITTGLVNFKYDYKANGKDILGFSVPKIISDSTGSWSGTVMKIGDGGVKDQFFIDTWATKKFGKISVLVEAGRIVSQAGRPWDCVGTRLSGGDFTTEFYILTYHPLFGEKITEKDATYGWIAYHPYHSFFAVGKQDRDYWGFAGTKNLKDFGNLTFLDYQPKTGNFWFKSQTGFGDVNQGFYCQDNYIIATSYLVVPVFYYKHFSPIAVKGDYTLKLEGRRTGNICNYEAMMGKKIGNDLFRFAAGVNSEYKNNLRVAPSFELYKSWKTKDFQEIVELRYDLVYKTFSAFLVFRY